jgi:hypothetical protein
MKTVIGFDSGQHCARCLRGDYVKAVGLKMPVNEDLALDYPEGTILYLCGVSTPYQWRNNLHLAVRVKAGATATAGAWTGDRVEILGAEALPIDGLVARRAFPSRNSAFLTCRNFQFGAQYF